MTDEHAADPQPAMLTREQIDFVLDHMTGADVVDNIGDGTQGAKIAGGTFDSAAARLGITNGHRAMELVALRDFTYLADRLSQAMNLDSPKSEAPEDSQSSPITGA